MTKGTWQRNYGGIVGPVGFPYYLGFGSSSAYASVAADYFVFSQPIEADAISDFAFGTSNAQPVTLSFWAQSSLTGTFSGALKNYAQTRAYPFTYSLPTANVWTKIAVTIPGDTGGTWVLNGNGGAMGLAFDLGNGSNNRGPAGAWASGGYNGATGSVSLVGTNGATFYVTGVKLEIGSVATPFNRQSLAKSMADCQRYYQQLGGLAGSLAVQGYIGASGAISATVGYPAMRAAPTIVSSAGTSPFTTINATTTFTAGANSVAINLSGLAVGQAVFYNNANGYLTLSAEL